jgi:hypothetical protein
MEVDMEFEQECLREVGIFEKEMPPPLPPLPAKILYLAQPANPAVKKSASQASRQAASQGASRNALQDAAQTTVPQDEPQAEPLAEHQAEPALPKRMYLY